MDKLHVLFVCGKNQWRSPTGEQLYHNDQRLEVRSAGLSKTAKRVLSARDVAWADLIFVMEQEQKRRLRKEYLMDCPDTALVCLDIPDDYPYMDPELIELLKTGVDSELLNWELS